MLNVPLKIIEQFVLVDMDLLEIHIPVVLNQDAEVISNVHQIKLALIENAKIHVPTKIVESMLNVKQGHTIQDANVYQII